MKTIWNWLQRLYYPTDPLWKSTVVILTPMVIAVISSWFSLWIIWAVAFSTQVFIIVLVILQGRKYLRKLRGGDQ